MPIALLTDFGTRDYFVGAMKGVIVGIDRKAVIVDISHEIEPQNISEAAFTLAACWRDFPEGTIFLCVVDPGVGSSRRAIAAEFGGRKFVCPDNGLLSLIMDEGASLHELCHARYFRPEPSNTFHGRDIFAPVAAHLSLGVPLYELGPTITDPVRIALAKPQLFGNELHGEVLHIDRFGNVITSISPDMIMRGSSITANGVKVSRWVRSYSEAFPDEPVLILGSAGFVEISVNGSSAAARLHVKVGDGVTANPAAQRGGR